MTWTPLTFGKYAGKTLPQIVFADPDWFFWAFEEAVFDSCFSLQSQAKEVHRRATSIKVPQTGTDELIAEYAFHPSDGKFCGVEVVPKSRPRHQGTTGTRRLPVFDLSLPRRLATYDKLGCKLLVATLKFYLFGDEHCRLTTKRCEDFFENDSNFNFEWKGQRSDFC